MKQIAATYLALAAFLASLGSQAGACESGPFNESWKRLKVSEDCSFEYAGRGSLNGYRGEAVVDIGGGRIGQKLTRGHACTTYETLLFMNCEAGAGVVIDGEYVDTLLGGVILESIAAIQHPRGPIGLTSKSEVDEVVRTAEKHNYQFSTDLKSYFARSKETKRISYSCGCKLYYPDSPGAKL